MKTPRLFESRIKNNFVSLISLEKAYLSLPLILSLRVFIKKFLKKKVKITIPLIVNYHYTQKGLGVRMGKGKGKPVKWLISVSRGTVLFSLIANKYNFFKLRTCLSRIRKKLYIYTKIIVNEKTFEPVYCE
jgi:large subunit ribosomal protein L16